MGFPLNARGAAGHDDILFMRLAVNMGFGGWLGAYDSLTHSKGFVYSLFILLNHATGISLLLTEHVCYLLASLFFSSAISGVCRSRAIGLAMFALLAFNPTVWHPDVGGRVVRENLYVSETLLLLGLGIRCWVAERDDMLADQWIHKRQMLAALGLVGGLFWMTCEEGVWLLPGIALMAVSWAWTQRAGWRRHGRLAARFVVFPVVSMAAVVLAVNGINWFYYGSFRNNDLRSSDFQAGYGALARIRQDQWQRYVVFPKEARERAYAMSAAARELRPYLEGEIGERWRVRGCERTGISPCPEILAGWFIWALRDAVTQAGHYSNAGTASSFYRTLAMEIDTGCQKRPEDCLPARATLTPPWHGELLADTWRASLAVYSTLAHLGVPVGDVSVSTGTPFQLAAVHAITNAELAPTVEAIVITKVPQRDLARRSIARWIGEVEAVISRVGLPIALAGWLAWGLLQVARRKVSGMLVVATALVATLTGRVVLLAFLEATTMTSNNIVLLFPATPLSLALVVVMAGMAWHAVVHAWRGWRGWPHRS